MYICIMNEYVRELNIGIIAIRNESTKEHTYQSLNVHTQISFCHFREIIWACIDSLETCPKLYQNQYMLNPKI